MKLNVEYLSCFELMHTSAFWKMMFIIYAPLLIVIFGIYYFKNSKRINNKIRELATWIMQLKQ